MEAALNKSTNVTWHHSNVRRADREKLHGHKGAVVWFTGLSASGKSTISHYVEQILHDLGCSTYVFDGDNVRHGLCGDLGFDEVSRSENIRRIGEMVNLFVDAGVIAITAFISPNKKDREKVRNIVGKENFIEVFVDCPIEVCIERDPKGIYAKALTGEIDNFTGVSAEYEPPEMPGIVLKTAKSDYFLDAERVVALIKEKRLIFSS
ncbi:adenylyl-sulfate kinase [Desulfoluna spongiiphila]|uniref:Adenylyl-sulfate kinase n=1 Tax=Desulfoluna spongiiphila TaxID=419481 RepID=A0A1G5IC64_9BACT|nr:adenylyl-sulfate kinase [Desulfoluna spongiiphila]SCY73574.1 adenylylsulfate kinase [Desulfoluna spongiiphila]